MSSSKGSIGKLRFKGDQPIKKSKSKSSHASGASTSTSSSSESIASSSSSAGASEIKEVIGTGRITSSLTTIHGHQTNFMSELAPGDAIIITHPTTLRDEMKVVRMVLSNVSMGISSAFSSDLISTTAFRYIKCPKDPSAMSSVMTEEEKQLKKRKSAEADVAEVIQGGTFTSATSGNIVYRVKKEGAFGGYKVVTESISSTASRESMLDQRSKKKSDRFCY